MENHVSDNEYEVLRMDVPSTDGRRIVFQTSVEDGLV